ncbi:TonB-dependent receptor [Komagataeibacter swingsii]|uniref:TonB-dependent receptor n=2 Tax=Komagataeibacter swingsii TaxID=215220 RepID=A0A2V4S6T6_9PROT|nr:TonB-dependent receptor [Komagataeibacter swingsii]
MSNIWKVISMYKKSHMLKNRRMALALGGAILPFPNVAYSQTLPAASGPVVHKKNLPHTTHAPSTPRTATPKPRIENVIVTSERRAQSAQNIPSSISVISSKVLENRNINNVFDLQYATPSLQVQPSYGSGQYTYTIRGVGFSGYSSNNSPTVGIYIDEVANPVPFGINGMMFDMQRVEVLRGPQGTLYGRNSTGGAINYITNKPTDTLKGGIAAQYGRFNDTKIDGYISGPITDKLRFRFATETQQGGAWQYNPEARESLGNVSRGAARLLLDYMPSDTLKFEYNLHGSIDRSDANGVHAWTPITSLSKTDPIQVSPDRYATTWGTSPAFAKEIGISPNTTPFSHIDTGGTNLRMEKKLPGFTITDLASYDYMQRNEYDNFDDSSLSLADVSFKTRASVFSNELRFSSNTGGRLHWIAGVYYGHQWLNDRYQSGFTNLYKTDGDVRYSQVVNTISGFGQLTYDITPKLHIVGGFRMEHESRHLDNVYAHYIVNNVITNPNNYVGQRTQSYTLPSAKFSIEYNPIHNDMAYFTFSKGVKSGGFTLYNSNNVAAMTEPFKPENLFSYEIGNKIIIPKYNIRFNADFFYYDYFDRQVQAETVNPNTGGIGIYVNAPRSHEYGGEYEFEWSPIPGLNISQSGAYVTGAYDQFTEVTGAIKGSDGLYTARVENMAGKGISVPHFMANGSVDYTWPIGKYNLNTGMNYSVRTTNWSPNPVDTIAGYTLWGAYMSIAPRQGHWKFEAIGENIFNKQYDVTRGYFVSGDYIGLAGRPATWYVRVRGDF